MDKSFIALHLHFQDCKVLSDAKFAELCSVVGVSKQCSFAPDQKLIEKAFRRNALKCHPDKGGDPVVFKKLNDAYYKLIGHTRKVEIVDYWNKLNESMNDFLINDQE